MQHLFGWYGAGDVAVATPDITRQCLDAELLDEIAVDLVPVRLADPDVIQGRGVTHLQYHVLKVDG